LEEAVEHGRNFLAFGDEFVGRGIRENANALSNVIPLNP
jgi:hypothetical protein